MRAGSLLPVLLVVLSIPSSACLTEVFLNPIALNVTHYATFQSHNQKVVSNENGIFLTYTYQFDLQTAWTRWRLVRSTDGGKTFSVVYTSPEMGSNAPCIDTDSDNNILLVCTDYNDPRDRPFYYYRFEAARNYTDPRITTAKYHASGKFSMYYHGESDLIYLFNHYGRLIVLNATSGKHVLQKDVMKTSGDNAMTQYPHVFVSPDGVLHHAWTTQKHSEYMYWDIHYARSGDGGRNWQTANGTGLPREFKPDDSGPSDQIIMGDEFDYHTWLTSMVVKGGKAHFAYLCQTPDRRMEYVRLDLETGLIDIRVQPFFGGETVDIYGLDGFFCTGPGTSPLYYVARANLTHIGALVSHDNGETWHDAAISEPLPNSIYSVGGCRELVPEGIIGSFTNQYGVYPDTIAGDVYFFRIPVPEAVHLMAFLLLPPVLRRVILKS